VLASILAFFSLAGLAQADICSFDNFGFPGVTATEMCTVGGGGYDESFAPPFQFTLSQFDPQLGQLQSASFMFSFDQVWGTASFNYPGVPSECNNPEVPFGNCASDAILIDYDVTVSGASIPTLDAGGASDVFAVNYCCTAGPQTVGWTDEEFFCRSCGAVLTLDAAQASAFIGTGRLTFNVNTSASDNVDSPTGTGASITMVNYGAEVDYNFTPAATPEPSLFYATGAALLGLIGMRLRRRSA
jgi:hypothetical protein